MHDKRAFSLSVIAADPARYFSTSEYMLGDAAYTTSFPFVLTPYKRPHSDLPKNRTFNWRLSRARITIEHCVGNMKAKFPALKCQEDKFTVRMRSFNSASDKSRTMFWIIYALQQRTIPFRIITSTIVIDTMILTMMVICFYQLMTCECAFSKSYPIQLKPDMKSKLPGTRQQYHTNANTQKQLLHVYIRSRLSIGDLRALTQDTRSVWVWFQLLLHVFSRGGGFQPLLFQAALLVKQTPFHDMYHHDGVSSLSPRTFLRGSVNVRIGLRCTGWSWSLAGVMGPSARSFWLAQETAWNWACALSWSWPLCCCWKRRSVGSWTSCCCCWIWVDGLADLVHGQSWRGWIRAVLAKAYIDAAWL